MTPKELTLKIDSLAYGPYGIGRNEGKVILVPLTAPGDLAEIQVVEERRNYIVAELSRLVTPSPLRQPPPCPYFGACGGCPWQHLQYEAQIAAKEKNVEDALRRIGRLDGFELLPILRSPQAYHYRRRIRLQTDDRKRIGFHRALSHELAEIDSCLIADPEIDRHLGHTREWISALKTPIQYVEILRGDGEKELLLVGKAKGGLAPGDDAMSSRFLEQHHDITGLILFGTGWRRFWGQGKILMRCENRIRMKVDGEVFTQVNREASSQLARELLQWGEFHDEDRVLELYAGAGNFTLPVAQLSQEVVAVEGDPRSVENGRANSQLNRLDNIRWVSASVPNGVKRLRERDERFSKIILNPPRAGAKGLEEDLAALGAEKILYVSCDPATLARDLGALTKKGYRLARVRPVDLFPHTFHVETLAEMIKLRNLRS